jgi:hypothetical protein
MRESTQHDLPLTGNPLDPEQRGWLIGIGGQYIVHDIGHGRVAKIRLITWDLRRD